MLRLVLILMPSLALAHGGAEGHAHPHGLEGVVAAAAVILVAALAFYAVRRGRK